MASLGRTVFASVSSVSRRYSCRRQHLLTSFLLRRGLSSVAPGEVLVKYENGLPVISIPLPSRREECVFTLKPVTQTLGDLAGFIHGEDPGIDRVAAYNLDQQRIARSTSIGILMQKPFELVVNEERYSVHPPASEALAQSHVEVLSDVKNHISQLYTTANVEEYQLLKEKQLREKLEQLEVELTPFEKAIQAMQERSTKRARYGTWLGLGYMSLQFGFLARLTWWEYSWDIMEPVTYFVTYGTTIFFYAYYCITRQEFTFPAVQDREITLHTHRQSEKGQFDWKVYRRLKEDVAGIRYDLRRLQDPLHLHLPVPQLPVPQLPKQLPESS